MTATLAPALDDALAYLINLSRDGTRPAAAQHRLRALRERHSGIALDLLWQEEAYDGSVHYDLLLRRSGEGTVGLSYCADRALPWSLRNMHRVSDRDLLRINATTLDIAQAVACLDFIWNEAPLAERLVNVCLIQEELAREPIALTDDELQHAMDAFRRTRRLFTATQTLAWMARRGLTHEQFEHLVSDEATIAKLRDRVTADRVDAYFTERRAEFDTARVARCVFSDVERARAAGQQLEAGTVSFFELAERRFRAATPEAAAAEGALFAVIRRGESPGWAAVFAASPGTVVGPVPTEEGYGVAQVLEIVPARLDDRTRRAIQKRLFDAWLEARRREARIEWYWGNTAVTQSAA